MPGDVGVGQGAAGVVLGARRWSPRSRPRSAGRRSAPADTSNSGRRNSCTWNWCPHWLPSTPPPPPAVSIICAWPRFMFSGSLKRGVEAPQRVDRHVALGHLVALRVVQLPGDLRHSGLEWHDVAGRPGAHPAHPALDVDLFARPVHAPVVEDHPAQGIGGRVPSANRRRLPSRGSAAGRPCRHPGGRSAIARRSWRAGPSSQCRLRR